jgi:hypothetical protein
VGDDHPANSDALQIANDCQKVLMSAAVRSLSAPTQPLTTALGAEHVSDMCSTPHRHLCIVTNSTPHCSTSSCPGPAHALQLPVLNPPHFQHIFTWICQLLSRILPVQLPAMGRFELTLNATGVAFPSRCSKATSAVQTSPWAQRIFTHLEQSQPPSWGWSPTSHSRWPNCVLQLNLNVTGTCTHQGQAGHNNYPLLNPTSINHQQIHNSPGNKRTGSVLHDM